MENDQIPRINSREKSDLFTNGQNLRMIVKVLSSKFL